MTFNCSISPIPNGFWFSSILAQGLAIGWPLLAQAILKSLPVLFFSFLFFLQLPHPESLIVWPRDVRLA